MEKKNYRIIVFSDTHGNVAAIEKVLPIINESDLFVYLGDGNRDIDKLQDKITTEIIRVAGNCDLVQDLPIDAEFKVGNKKFFATHGHKYGVKSSLLTLSMRARELKCDFALYGHNHKAAVFDAGGVTLINPGTTARGYEKSYAQIVGDGENFSAEIIRLNN